MERMIKYLERRERWWVGMKNRAVGEQTMPVW
jgi:hypothetical protein